MAAMKIHGAERQVNKLLSDDYAFEIPAYQRPFAWDSEDATTLVDDLLTSMGDDEDTKPEELSPYFLGSLVLIKDEGKPKSDVVDGQQRLTTLTILLAVLREAVSDANLANELETYIYTKGHVTKGTTDHYRLTVRARDNDFFRTYVQTRGNLDRLERLDPKQIDGDGQRRLREVTLAVRDKINTLSDGRRAQLAVYILRQCIVVVVTSADIDAAFRIFSVLNDRGVNLSAADILKADIIGKIEDKEKRMEEAQRWEDLEDNLGRDDFLELFSHIRMIYRKQMITSLLNEFRGHIIPTVPAEQFIDTVLRPYGDAYSIARDSTFASTSNAEEINTLLKWLRGIDNVDWYPPAITAIQTWAGDPDKLHRFLKDLERLAAVMLILRANRTQRSARYANVLSAIENESDMFASDSPLQLESAEKANAIDRLRGPVYQLPGKVPQYIMLRLDEALSDGSASYDFPIISIEHVLPQNPMADSEWQRAFPDEDDREALVHTIGNLVLLSRRKNASARNWDFKKKKEKYFTGKDGVSPFAITSGVLAEKNWTKQVIDRRTNDHVTKLRSVWRLA